MNDIPTNSEIAQVIRLILPDECEWRNCENLEQWQVELIEKVFMVLVEGEGYLCDRTIALQGHHIRIFIFDDVPNQGRHQSSVTLLSRYHHRNVQR